MSQWAVNFSGVGRASRQLLAERKRRGELCGVSIDEVVMMKEKTVDS
jgi:hypothetical protein